MLRATAIPGLAGADIDYDAHMLRGRVVMFCASFALLGAACVTGPAQVIVELELGASIPADGSLRVVICGERGAARDKTIALRDLGEGGVARVPVSSERGNERYGLVAVVSDATGCEHAALRVIDRIGAPGERRTVRHSLLGDCAAACAYPASCREGACVAPELDGAELGAAERARLLACAPDLLERHAPDAGIDVAFVDAESTLTERCNALDDDADGRVDEAEDEGPPELACELASLSLEVVCPFEPTPRVLRLNGITITHPRPRPVRAIYVALSGMFPGGQQYVPPDVGPYDAGCDVIRPPPDGGTFDETYRAAIYAYDSAGTAAGARLAVSEPVVIEATSHPQWVELPLVEPVMLGTGRYLVGLVSSGGNTLYVRNRTTSSVGYTYGPGALASALDAGSMYRFSQGLPETLEGTMPGADLDVYMGAYLVMEAEVCDGGL